MTLEEIDAKAIGAIVADYRAAQHILASAVRRIFPIGSWAKVRSIVGKVHAYCTDADWISLLLEHGDTRCFEVDKCVPTTVPWWGAKAEGM